MSSGGEQASVSGNSAAVCHHCGAAYHKAGAKFCSRCGTSRETKGGSTDKSRKTRPRLDDTGLGSAGGLTSTTTPAMPPLFPPPKAEGGPVAALGGGGGNGTLRPFDVEHLHQLQKQQATQLGHTSEAATTPLEFRDPSAVTSLTSPKRHSSPAVAAVAAVAAAAAEATAVDEAALDTSPSLPSSSSAAASRPNGSHREGHKSSIYAKDSALPELPPASLADPRRSTRNHSTSSEEPETRFASTSVDTFSGAGSSGALARAPVPPRGQQPAQGSRPTSASPLSAHGRRRASKSRKQERAVEDVSAFVDGVAEKEGGEEATGSLRPSAEEEAQYTAWATLPPDGLTPEMLQTSNASELRKWRKGSLIGRGTYGSVYLGLLPDGSFYAVKSVELGNRKAAADHLNILELVSLSREINMMHRLRHRNLCTFKGVYYDSENAAICMFMEYIGGGSLSSLVKRFKPLPPSVVRSWTTQLLSGLQYLHTQHIIHRDIKGDNVLVDTSADPSALSQIKLVDFGAARRLTDAVSQSSTVIGTPYWMAPEVVDASGEGGGYSYQADVWSVGCTVAEMLTGRPPWPSKTSAPAAIMMIASATGMPTEIPEEEATPGCLDFMRKCFIRDPEKRPTVQALLQHPWIQGKME